MGSTPSKETGTPRASTLDSTRSKGGKHRSSSKKRTRANKENVIEKSKKGAKENGRISTKRAGKNKSSNARSREEKATKNTKSKERKQPKETKKDKYLESRDVSDKERRPSSMSSSTRGESTKRDEPSSLRTDQNSSKLRPSRIKTFRINVPSSMEPNDIMTLKLGGIQTKILITTPTSSNSKHAKAEGEVENKMESCPPSSSSLTSSLIPTNTTKYPDPHSDNGSNIVVSTAANIPEGRLLKEAKPVIVVHATFSEKNQQLKEQMIDETVKEIIQEALNAGCNGILGVMVSIKEEKDNSGYLVKACGTPCVLVPAQIRLTPPAKSITCSTPFATRQRASSTELTHPPKVDRAT